MTLSIITINYNNLEGLRKTIDSVLCQTWIDFEWIFIDGGSTDGSKELIEKTAAECPNVSYWCSEPDKGVYNAMNKGISKAKGEYLNFMNSGDCFADEKSLQVSSRHFETKKDIYYGDADFFDSTGQLFLALRLPETLDAFFYINGNNLSHQASFIKRELLVKRPYDESYKLAADGEFFFYALLNDYSFEHIPNVILASDVPGLSSDIDRATIEKRRLVSENLKNASCSKRLFVVLKKLRREISFLVKGLILHF